jgi:tRNA A-37 threonylcarbamoyl transferase component Bud32
MKTFIAKKWKNFLRNSQLDSFDAWWKFKAGWFEEPNERRGGWSGASRVELDNPEGKPVAFFLKRQQEHTTRTWRHPIKGILTFEREAENILACQKAGVPAVELVLFEQKVVDGKRCAVLETVALDNFTELKHITNGQQRRTVIRACADTVRRLHAANLQHNCLYPKHIFVRLVGNKAEAKLIDLEKTKHVRHRRKAALRDLDSLNRHTEDWSKTDKLRFLLDYLGTEKVDSKVRTLWHDLVTLAECKMKKRA